LKYVPRSAGKVVEIEATIGVPPRPGGFLRGATEVSFAFTPEARPGDYVLVHAGFALTVVDQEEALLTLEELRRLGEAVEASPETAEEAPAP